MKNYKYTEEDIEFLKSTYPQGKWDEIYKRFPDVKSSQIRAVCFKHQIKSEHNCSENLDSKRWLPEEDEILITMYEKHPINEIMQMLSGRSYNSIVSRAAKYNLKSLHHREQAYSNDEIEYIKQNWQKYSDVEIANYLNRTKRSVKWKRERLGLYRWNPNEQLTYDNLEKYLRGNIYNWKNDSMRSCDYQCVLTGSKNFAIHHLYSFSFIMREFVKQYEGKITNDINNYDKEELKKLTIQFNEFHNRFPLGVCVDKDIHKLFHHIYGKNINTPKQWDEFVENYKKGKYNH